MHVLCGQKLEYHREKQHARLASVPCVFAASRPSPASTDLFILASIYLISSFLHFYIQALQRRDCS